MICSFCSFFKKGTPIFLKHLLHLLLHWFNLYPRRHDVMWTIFKLESDKKITFDEAQKTSNSIYISFIGFQAWVPLSNKGDQQQSMKHLFYFWLGYGWDELLVGIYRVSKKMILIRGCPHYFGAVKFLLHQTITLPHLSYQCLATPNKGSLNGS